MSSIVIHSMNYAATFKKMIMMTFCFGKKTKKNKKTKQTNKLLFSFRLDTVLVPIASKHQDQNLYTK